MSTAAIVVLIIWFVGMGIHYVWWGNDMRLALNNLTPGAKFSDYAKPATSDSDSILAPSSRKG